MVTNLPELVVMNIQFKLSHNYYNTPTSRQSTRQEYVSVNIHQVLEGG